MEEGEEEEEIDEHDTIDDVHSTLHTTRAGEKFLILGTEFLSRGTSLRRN